MRSEKSNLASPFETAEARRDESYNPAGSPIWKTIAVALTTERLNAAMVAVAIAGGAWIRFAGLATREFTSDEGDTWAVAAAPTMADVIRQTRILNPGKLGLHDAIEHLWMGIFGDSVTALRALAATIGTIAIVLVMMVARELLESDGGDATINREGKDTVAALATLIFTFNPIAVYFSRDARMYPLMLATTLAQVWFFLRAIRLGGIGNYVGAGVFAVLTAAANLAALAIFPAEGLWMLYILSRHGWSPAHPRSRRVWGLAIALAVAGLILLAVTPMKFEKGVYPIWSLWFIPLAVSATWAGLYSMLRGPILWITLALSGLGIARAWRAIPQALGFALVWLWIPVVPVALYLRAPVIMLSVIGAGWCPIFLHRYVLSCIVPFAILIALGVWCLRWNPIRAAVVALIVALSIPAIYRTDQSELRSEAKMREAAEMLVPYLREQRRVNVEPPYTTAVLKYYLRTQRGLDPNLLTSGDPRAPMLLITDQALHFLPTAQIEIRAYPVTVKRLPGVWLLEKPDQWN